MKNQNSWDGPQHEGDSLFELCRTDCAAIMTQADAECQSLWNALHATRHSIIEIDGAMAELNRQCLAIRAQARKRCEQVREASCSARVKLTESNYDFTY